MVGYQFTTPVTARYFTFSILNNYDNEPYVGLSEVRFSVVPEPTTFVLFGVGMMGLLLSARQRHSR